MFDLKLRTAPATMNNRTRELAHAHFFMFPYAWLTALGSPGTTISMQIASSRLCFILCGVEQSSSHRQLALLQSILQLIISIFHLSAEKLHSQIRPIKLKR